jgi:hypothetical protein
MDEVLFISEDFLKSNSVISNNADFEKIVPIIIGVQDIQLQQILGTPLYEDLKTKYSASPSSLNSDEITLIKNYIQKVILHYVVMESTLDFKFKYMNKGVMVKNAENSQPADTKDLLMLMDRSRVKAEQYAEILTRYLTCNTTKFPKYTEITTVGLNASNTNYTTGIYLDDDYHYEQGEPKKIIISVS